MSAVTRLFPLFSDGIRINRDRQGIPETVLYTLLGLALLPLAAVCIRLLALASPAPMGVLVMGEWLNHSVSLNWIGPQEREVVLYILLLPLAALLTALARLTLGIRVLGFRAILIAIGFREIGVLPCLLLIVLITAAVLLVRPMMRRAGLPLYARIAVILCIVSLTMITALIAGSWLDSVTLWSMAFFPVVILAMLAESVASTAARESVTLAVWRVAATIVLAALIAALSSVTALAEMLMFCPELLVSVLVSIVFVAEFLDLRLLERLQPGKTGLRAFGDLPVVAVVRNRFPEPPPRRTSGQPARRYRRASLQPMIDGLRARGHHVAVIECDGNLPKRLHALAKAAFAASGPGLIVMNCAGGAQGAGALAQVPTICEMLGVPYTGPGPQAPVLLDDRLEHIERLKDAGLRVPSSLSYEQAFKHLRSGTDIVWARPRFAADRRATRINTCTDLERTIAQIERRYGEVHFELRPPGQSITAIVLRAEQVSEVRVLPLIQENSDGLPSGVYRPSCALERERLERAAQHAALALECRDCTRVDLYLESSGEVTVSRVVAIDPPTSNSSTLKAAALAGLSLDWLTQTVLVGAVQRDSGNCGASNKGASRAVAAA